MKRNILGAIWVMGVLSFAGFCLSSCTPELDVQQAYDFSLQTLPVQKDVIKGAVAEIRCSLKAEGDFNPNRSLDRYNDVCYGEKITSCYLSFACWHLVFRSFSP